MKFNYILIFFAKLVATACASHIVSGSNSKLPMSLSSVINDLEAEGATAISTVAFITSRGIKSTNRSKILRSLFGITGEGDHDDEVVDGETSAFGRKMGDQEDEVEYTVDDPESVRPSIGIAVANPFPNASISEVASTVEACGGNIVYLASSEDLNRGEGLFDKLAPAIEQIVNDEKKNNDNLDDQSSLRTKKILIVVVEGATTPTDLLHAKAKFEIVASSIFSSIVQPCGSSILTLQEVFDSVEYVTSTGPVDILLEDIGCTRDPPTAMAHVASAVYKDTQATFRMLEELNASPLDLAAARKLLPLSHEVLNSCLMTVKDYSSDRNGMLQLVTEFGSLCDETVKRTMEFFDVSAGPFVFKVSNVARHIRCSLIEQIYFDLEELYEKQLSLAHDASFESFKSNLSKVRLSPNLASDMKKVAIKAINSYIDLSKTIRTKKGVWKYDDAALFKFKKELNDYIDLRLQTARVGGKYTPVPRKGFALGLHWLLPKPFGNDYRVEPWRVHSKDNLVYIPNDKITDVRKEDIMAGDWTESITPCPASNEMMYLK